MSKITNDGLTWSSTGCFIAVIHMETVGIKGLSLCWHLHTVFSYYHSGNVLLFFLQNPITNFSFPFTSLAEWFPEGDVLKKREKLRQLVLNLQSRLNPDLQYDVQQGTIQPAAMMPMVTAGDDSSVGAGGDAALLNPDVTTSDVDSVNMMQSDAEPTDSNDRMLSNDSVDHMSGLVLSDIHDCDAADIAASIADDTAFSQTVVVGTSGDVRPVTCSTFVTKTAVGNDGVDETGISATLPGSALNSEACCDVHHEAAVSSCTTQCISDNALFPPQTVEHLLGRHCGNRLVSGGDKPCSASCSGNSLALLSDVAASYGIIGCTEPQLQESTVSGTDMQQSSRELIGADS